MGQTRRHPAAPTGLTATGGDGSVSLNWADNTDPDLASYNVKRSTTTTGPYAEIATDVGASAYTDNTVTNDITYFYVVTAEDTTGNESANSNEASATPAGAATGMETIKITKATYSARRVTLKVEATSSLERCRQFNGHLLLRDHRAPGGGEDYDLQR